MEKARKAPRFRRRIIVLVVVVVVAAVVGGVLRLRHSTSSPTTIQAPVVTSVPTTDPYRPRPGPNGTKLLTEAVDPLTLAVPDSWQTPTNDPLNLPGVLDNFALQAPPLATLLQVEAGLAEKSAIRLFAYQLAAPHAFVAVVSYASPGVDALTASGVDAIVAASKKATPNVAVSGAQLPAGQALKVDSSFLSQKQQLVVEVLVLVTGGRTIEIEMVAEVNVAGIPPVFAQVAQSLRLS